MPLPIKPCQLCQKFKEQSGWPVEIPDYPSQPISAAVLIVKAFAATVVAEQPNKWLLHLKWSESPAPAAESSVPLERIHQSVWLIKWCRPAGQNFPAGNGLFFSVLVSDSRQPDCSSRNCLDFIFYLICTLSRCTAKGSDCRRYAGMFAEPRPNFDCWRLHASPTVQRHRNGQAAELDTNIHRKNAGKYCRIKSEERVAE